MSYGLGDRRESHLAHVTCLPFVKDRAPLDVWFAPEPNFVAMHVSLQ